LGCGFYRDKITQVIQLIKSTYLIFAISVDKIYSPVKFIGRSSSGGGYQRPYSMNPILTKPNDNQRHFFRLEDPATDFPFYNGSPVKVTSRQWWFVIAAVVVAFLSLALTTSWSGGAFWSFIPAAALAALPLMALARVAPGHWRSLFGRVHFRELRLMLGFALLNLVVSMALGVVVLALTQVANNSSTAQLGSLDIAGRIAFFAKTLPQLLGEEVITILPFLALLQWFTQALGWGRKSSILVAWVGTSVLFGLLHLPTYDWNWVQCIVVIGSARMLLTLPWIMTKNLWVSTGAHITNDWLLFAVGLWGAGLAGTS
jgi:membrane protease YdiL (CAAX protease family)